ncbi:E3 ubiquitin-protein ligase RNF31 isoform X3 [Cynoglossus semilaevis]|uniref:E3 ubiquitin-protein ligase RNF31 isoform X3 n=1 Tax=Cynoglossus semilaevis TaxID=244447 RepID=UPI000497468A|nr:E3 ubiquitin-protein ligase RNF31-like isoform X3 [Cynoglossus semilaevis]
MPLVVAGAELRTLTECNYTFPAEALSDVQEVRASYSDLRIYVDYYVFPDKTKKKLLYLAGTLPVCYEGSSYNIPVCIWLHETHPASRPRCYVCPSVSMVINPSCPYVDKAGILSLNGLRNWTHGVSSLSQLMSEMRQVFQVNTPLYSSSPVQPPSPTSVAEVWSGSESGRNQQPTVAFSSNIFCSPSIFSSSDHTPARTASQWGQRRGLSGGKSYLEELLEIDFTVPPPPSIHSNPLRSPSLSDLQLSNKMDVLTLTQEDPGEQTIQTVADSVSTVCWDGGPGSRLSNKQAKELLLPEPEGSDGVAQLASGGSRVYAGPQLRPDQVSIYRSLMEMEDQKFSPTDVIEAVQLTKDLPSALRFLNHCCPICQDQVTFSKVVFMTHCSCSICQSCFSSFFSSAIKERSIHQLVCPQCGRPDVRQGALGDAMEFFNLLDTQVSHGVPRGSKCLKNESQLRLFVCLQIRHFLSPQDHELFQRKLRDGALQETNNFCWCAHCSFGMFHDSGQLRMDCANCKKSTCSQCRTAWTPEHLGLSCDQFKLKLQQNQNKDLLKSTRLTDSRIECPQCQCVFSLSRGGCLHFTCSQCKHHFCGGCAQTFSVGAMCSFSGDCSTRGLHAHHPRDCLYHLRDWTMNRLKQLLQFYQESVEPVLGSSDLCQVLVLKDSSELQDEPCGKPALTEHLGYCRSHYKEVLVEHINRCHADPAVLFSIQELMSELQRWKVPVPTRRADELEQAYAQRLRLTVTTQLPLRR